MTNNKPNDVRVVSVELLEELLDAAKWKAADFTKASPYRSKIDEVVRRTKDLLAQPADQQGEPVAWANGEQLLLCSRSRLDVGHSNPIYRALPRNIAGSALKTEYCDTPLYRRAQPATAKVVLPERTTDTQSCSDVAKRIGLYGSVSVWQLGEIWNACPDEVAKLNTPQ